MSRRGVGLSGPYPSRLVEYRFRERRLYPVVARVGLSVVVIVCPLEGESGEIGTG